jgi:hypothetical protein
VLQIIAAPAFSQALISGKPKGALRASFRIQSQKFWATSEDLALPPQLFRRLPRLFDFGFLARSTLASSP